LVLALAALAAAAASFPTGFGFGAGYGAGVRIGYDVIYPKIAPFAAKITDDIIGQVGKLFGGDAGQIASQSGAGSGFDFASQRSNRPKKPADIDLGAVTGPPGPRRPIRGSVRIPIAEVGDNCGRLHSQWRDTIVRMTKMQNEIARISKFPGAGSSSSSRGRSISNSIKARRKSMKLISDQLQRSFSNNKSCAVNFQP